MSAREGTTPLKGNDGPKGKLQKIFEKTAILPRRQQEKIAEFVSSFFFCVLT
jgi:hypothetical protein